MHTYTYTTYICTLEFPSALHVASLVKSQNITIMHRCARCTFQLVLPNSQPPCDGSLHCALLFWNSHMYRCSKLLCMYHTDHDADTNPYKKLVWRASRGRIWKPKADLLNQLKTLRRNCQSAEKLRTHRVRTYVNIIMRSSHNHCKKSMMPYTHPVCCDLGMILTGSWGVPGGVGG